MVSFPDDEQSHAVTSSIEETHALNRKNDGVWRIINLINSLRLTRGSVVTFLPLLMSQDILLFEQISKRLAAVVRHREIENRVLCFRSYDVIVNVKNCESTQILSDGVIYTEEATNRDFSIVLTRTTISSSFVSFKVTQEMNWQLLNCLIMLQFHQDGKNSCIMWEVPTLWARFYKKCSSQVERVRKMDDRRSSSLH